MKVSVITIVYNDVESIEKTMESVLQQTYRDIEYIVVDGGSDDGTQDMLRRYSDRIDRLVMEPDEGIYDAMNKGVKLATGDVIGFANAGDFLADRDVISAIVHKFDEQSLDIVYGDKAYVDEGGQELVRYWTAGTFERGKFRSGWMPPHLSTYIRRECYDKWGSFRDDMDISADYELMLRFIYFQKAKTAYLSKLIIIMKMGGVSNGSIANILKANIEVYKSWRVNNGHLSPWVIFTKPLKKAKQFFSSKKGNISLPNY